MYCPLIAPLIVSFLSFFFIIKGKNFDNLFAIRVFSCLLYFTILLLFFFFVYFFCQQSENNCKTIILFNILYSLKSYLLGFFYFTKVMVNYFFTTKYSIFIFIYKYCTILYTSFILSNIILFPISNKLCTTSTM